MIKFTTYISHDLINILIANNPDLIGQRATVIPFKIKFLTALHIYSHGNYQKPTESNFLFAQRQSSVSSNIKLVTQRLLGLASTYIKFPSTAEVLKTNVNL